MLSHLLTNTNGRNQKTHLTATVRSRATTGHFPGTLRLRIPRGLPPNHLNLCHPTSALCRPWLCQCRRPHTSASLVRSSSLGCPWWFSLTKVSRTSNPCSPWAPLCSSYSPATPPTLPTSACTHRRCLSRDPGSFPSPPLIWAGTSRPAFQWRRGLRCRGISQGPPPQELGCLRVPPPWPIRYRRLGLGMIWTRHSPRLCSPARAPARPSNWTCFRKSWPNP